MLGSTVIHNVEASHRDDKSAHWVTWRRATAIKGIASAVVTFPVVTWALFTFWPMDYRGLDRMGIVLLALQWLPLIGIFPFFMFTRTGRLFDNKAAEEVLAGNTEMGEESPRWKRNQRIYTNTVEQVVFFVPMFLALSSVVPASQAQILPVLCCLWLFGRICYHITYHIEPAYRAFGFDYTLFPGLLAAGWFGVRVFLS